MDCQSLFTQFLSGDVAHQASTFRSLVIFSPELVLSCSIVLMLLARLTSIDRIIPTHWIALLDAAGVPCGVVSSVLDSLRALDASPQTSATPTVPVTLRIQPPAPHMHAPAPGAPRWSLLC